jgi:hypothetical protein
VKQPHLVPYLSREVEKWAAKTFATLCSELAEPKVYSDGAGEKAYKVEAKILNKEAGTALVCVSVNDEGEPAQGLSYTFLMYTDGRVLK